jgi:hypothetical protein
VEAQGRRDEVRTRSSGGPVIPGLERIYSFRTAGSKLGLSRSITLRVRAVDVSGELDIATMEQFPKGLDEAVAAVRTRKTAPGVHPSDLARGTTSPT